MSCPCITLTALLGSQKVAYPGSDAYTASLSSYFSQQEAAVQPACIVSPQTADDVSAALVSLQLQHENGQDCSFAVRSGGITLVSATWFTPADDALVGATAQSLLDAINTAAKWLGGLDPYIYLNYAGQYQDPISSYGAKSIGQLQQVKKRVDPKGTFTHQVPGGYKIPS